MERSFGRESTRKQGLWMTHWTRWTPIPKQGGKSLPWHSHHGTLTGKILHKELFSWLCNGHRSWDTGNCSYEHTQWWSVLRNADCNTGEQVTKKGGKLTSTGQYFQTCQHYWGGFLSVQITNTALTKNSQCCHRRKPKWTRIRRACTNARWLCIFRKRLQIKDSLD